MTILEANFKWHLEAFASELFKYIAYVQLQCFNFNKEYSTLLLIFLLSSQFEKHVFG